MTNPLYDINSQDIVLPGSTGSSQDILCRSFSPTGNECCQCPPLHDDSPFNYYDLCCRDTPKERVLEIIDEQPINPSVSAWMIDQAKKLIEIFNLDTLPSWLANHVPNAKEIYYYNRPQELLATIRQTGQLPFAEQEIHHTDIKGLNVLHYACMWNDLGKWILIRALLRLPNVFCRDVDGNFPFDLLHENESRTLVKVLEGAPYPGFPDATKGNAYRWLGRLCHLKNPKFALNYVNHIPHSLLPLEYQDFNLIKNTGGFIPHRIKDLPLLIMESNNWSVEVIRQFLDIWNDKMSACVGIDSSFFLLYLNEKYYPPGVSTGSFQTDLWLTFPLNIEEYFIQFPKVCFTQLLMLSKLATFMGTDQQKSQLLEKISLCIKSAQSEVVIKFCFSCYFLVYITCSDPALPENFFKDQSYFELIPELTKILLNGFKTSDRVIEQAAHFLSCLEEQANVVQDNAFAICPQSEEAVYTALILCNSSPFFKKYFHDFLSIHFFKKFDCIPLICYELAKAADIPIVNSGNTLLTLKNITTQIESVGYYIFTESFIEEHSFFTHLVLQDDNTFNEPLEGIQLILYSENGLNWVSALDTVTGYSINLRVYVFAETLHLLQKAIVEAMLLERAIVTQKTDEDQLLSYISADLPYEFKAPNVLNLKSDKVSSFRNELENSIDSQLPVRISPDLIENQLVVAYFCFSTNSIKLDQIEINSVEELKFDLPKHIEIWLSRYKRTYAKHLNEIKANKDEFHRLWPDLNYITEIDSMNKPGKIFQRLITILQGNEGKPTVIANWTLNRYFLGWKTGEHTHTIILPYDLEERKETVINLRKLHGLLTEVSMNREILKQHVNLDRPKLPHDGPADVTHGEIMQTYKEIFPEKNAEEQNKFSEMAKIILDKVGFSDLSAENDAADYEKMKIMFTHVYKERVARGDKQELARFISEITYHREYCTTGIQKELWQQYSCLFADDIQVSELSFLKRAVTQGLCKLRSNLQRCSIDSRGQNQSVHLSNFIHVQISSKVIPLPPDPEMLFGYDPFSDPYQSSVDVRGDDYTAFELQEIAKSTLLLITVLELIGFWKSVVNEKHEEYPDLFREFLAVPRTPSLTDNSIKEREARIQFLRKENKDKTKAIVKLKEKNAHVWQEYCNRLTFKPRKRNRKVDSAVESKRQRGGAKISDKIFVQACLSETRKHPIITQILNEEAAILKNKNEIDALTYKNRAEFELFAEPLYERKELTKVDELTEMQSLTLTGALTWLKGMGLFQESTISSQASSSNAS